MWQSSAAIIVILSLFLCHSKIHLVEGTGGMGRNQAPYVKARSCE